MNARTLVLSWLRTHTRGRPSDASVTIPVSELQEIQEALEDTTDRAWKKTRRRRHLTKQSGKRPARDKKLLAFARTRRCCNPSCTTPYYRNEANHYGRKADKGMARKPPDHQIVTLCWNCHHGEYHRTGGCLQGMTKEETLAHFERENRLLLADYDAQCNEGEAF